MLRSIGIPVMHDTSLCGSESFPTSYDEYTASVKRGEVTSEYVGRRNVSLMKPGYLDLLSYGTFLLLI